MTSHASTTGPGHTRANAQRQVATERGAGSLALGALARELHARGADTIGIAPGHGVRDVPGARTSRDRGSPAASAATSLVPVGVGRRQPLRRMGRRRTILLVCGVAVLFACVVIARTPTPSRDRHSGGATTGVGTASPRRIDDLVAAGAAAPEPDPEPAPARPDDASASDEPVGGSPAAGGRAGRTPRHDRRSARQRVQHRQHTRTVPSRAPVRSTTRPRVAASSDAATLSPVL